MSQSITIQITKGNYARLQAVSGIMKITPEELLNNALMKVMEGPEEMPFLSRWERFLTVRTWKQPKALRTMVEKLNALGRDGWQCEPLKQ